MVRYNYYLIWNVCNDKVIKPHKLHIYKVRVSQRRYAVCVIVARLMRVIELWYASEFSWLIEIEMMSLNPTAKPPFG